MSHYSKEAEQFFSESLSIHLNEYRKIESEIKKFCNDFKLNFKSLLQQDIINKFKENKICYLPLFVICDINTYFKEGDTHTEKNKDESSTTYYGTYPSQTTEQIERIVDTYHNNCIKQIEKTTVYQELDKKSDKNHDLTTDLFNVCGIGGATNPTTDIGKLVYLTHYISREQDDHDWDNIIEPIKKKYFKRD